MSYNSLEYSKMFYWYNSLEYFQDVVRRLGIFQDVVRQLGIFQDVVRQLGIFQNVVQQLGISRCLTATWNIEELPLGYHLVFIWCEMIRINKSAQGRWVVSADRIRNEHILSMRSVTNEKSQSCWFAPLGCWGWL